MSREDTSDLTQAKSHVPDKTPKDSDKDEPSVLNGTRVLVLLTVLAISIFSQINISYRFSGTVLIYVWLIDRYYD